jgi:hypothetical protein
MKKLCPRKDAPFSGFLAQAGTSGPHPSQNFRLLNFRPSLEPELSTNLIKRAIRVWLFYSDPNYSKLVENLENKPWRDFLLG